MNYPGGKNNQYQKLINLMPPHETYIEAYLGSGAILRRKRPAARNIGIDSDAAVIAAFNDAACIDDIATNDGAAAHQIICADCVQWLANHPELITPQALIYADPPYVMSSRKQQRPLYNHEYTDQQHVDLLNLLKRLDCMVMISGYWSQLYADMLTGWHTFSYQAQTRGGSIATEWVWMNYPEPLALHDYSFLGDDYRERERIKRKKQRHVARLQKMDALERRAILWAMQESGLLELASSEMALRPGRTVENGDDYR